MRLLLLFRVIFKKVLIETFKFKTFNLVEKPIGINLKESNLITKISKMQNQLIL